MPCAALLRATTGKPVVLSLFAPFGTRATAHAVRGATQGDNGKTGGFVIIRPPSARAPPLMP